MTKIFLSRKGPETALCNGIQIHSRFDPEREACRFIEDSMEGIPALLITLGTGLQYMEKEIVRRNPGVRILVLPLVEDFSKNRHRLKNVRVKPIGESVRNFLYRNLREEDLASLEVMEWPAGCRAVPEKSRLVREELMQVIRQYSGTLQSKRIFGKKEIKNILRNLRGGIQRVLPRWDTTPILICASGPSLQNSLAEIAEKKEGYSIWALPSSVEALLANGIRPDLVITTDRGYYAGVHLRNLPSNIPLVMPMTACRGSAENNPVVLFQEGGYPETLLMKQEGLQLPMIPGNGTVAGTALEWALVTPAEKIILAGQDFCGIDVRQHVRPHGFEVYIDQKRHLFQPGLHLHFQRMLDYLPLKLDEHFRTSMPLQTYAGWFSRLPAKARLRVFRLNPSPIPLGFNEIDHLPGNHSSKNHCSFTQSSRLDLSATRWLNAMHTKLNKQKKKLGTVTTFPDWSLFDLTNEGNSIVSIIDLESWLEAYRFHSLQKYEDMLKALNRAFDNAVNYIMEQINGVKHGCE